LILPIYRKSDIIVLNPYGLILIIRIDTNNFKTGLYGETYSILRLRHVIFFASVTSNWWYAKVPEKKRVHEYEETKRYFEEKGIRHVTDDIVIGYGTKPLSQ
jgi:hypothetical protein